MTAVGRVIDIPLVIRSLLDGLAMLQEDYLPAPFDTDLIQMIEAGTGEGHGKVVEKYHLQWWSKAKRPGNEWIMNQENISACVDHYENQLKKEGCSNSHIDIIPNPTSSTSAVDSATVDFIATHSTNKIKDLLNTVNRHRRASEGKVQLSARRAACLYMLFSKVMWKETEDTPAAGPIVPGKKGEVAETMHRKSQALLKAQKNVKQEGSQWTSGTTLTRKDVMGLVHISSQEEHSGYNSTHLSGTLSGIDSSGGNPEDMESEANLESGETGAANNTNLPPNTVYPRPISSSKSSLT